MLRLGVWGGVSVGRVGHAGGLGEGAGVWTDVGRLSAGLACVMEWACATGV
jgi:hypothetical protein